MTLIHLWEGGWYFVSRRGRVSQSFCQLVEALAAYRNDELIWMDS